ncbi:MAG: hypothetical protein F7C35_04530 [Desulfurococcales archaeon]|nr:hypothetical protein [Desulfurococcales archaeon]
MELTREEAIVLELMKLMKKAGRRVDKLALEKLVFLVAHGEFNYRGELVGLRVFPRIDVDYRIYFRGVHSRDVYEIIERLIEKGLVEERGDTYEVRSNVRAQLPEALAKILSYVARLAGLSPKELERLTNELLGIRDDLSKTLVFNASVIKLLKAREEARRLRQQGLIVDV